MRVWTSAWIEPGRLDCAASPALRRSWTRNSGLPSARSTQLATIAAGMTRRAPAGAIPRRQGPEIDAGKRRAMEDGAPGARARVAGKASRHHQQQRLSRGEQGERGKALERPGVGPVDVLDHEEQRRAVRPSRRDRTRRAASLARGPRAHRRGKRAKLGRRGDVEQVVEEQWRSEAIGRARRRVRSPLCASGSTVPATSRRLRARLRIASRPVSAPKSSTARHGRRSRAPAGPRTRRRAGTCRPRDRRGR